MYFYQGDSVINCFEVNTGEPYLSQGKTKKIKQILKKKKNRLNYSVLIDHQHIY